MMIQEEFLTQPCISNRIGVAYRACCSVPQFVTVCRSMLSSVAATKMIMRVSESSRSPCMVVQRVAACCSVLQCVAVCCGASVLQYRR